MAINWPKIEYVEAEDGMLYSKLDYPQQPAGNIGKYGEMRRRYLQGHRKTTYSLMILEGTLKRYLMDVNEQAHQQIEELIDDLLKANPAPDKAANQLSWIQHIWDKCPTWNSVICRFIRHRGKLSEPDV